MSERQPQWRINEVVRASQEEVGTRMTRAMVFARDFAVRLVNISNVGGTQPSKEGEPPRKGTGGLQTKFATDVDTSRPGEVIGYLGNAAAQARRLELGFVGTDTRGRRYAQGARPYLRRTLFDNRDQFRRILGAA